MREAIRLEEALETAPANDPAASGPDQHDEADVSVSRQTQQALLPVATAVVGAALGGLFGVVFALVRRFIRDPDDWRATLKLGAAAWTVMALVPLLVAPPNPPGVGDPAAVGTRSGWYLGAIGLAIALAVAIWLFAYRLRATDLRDSVRQAVVGAASLAGFGGLVLVLPVSAEAEGLAFPGELLWQFRLASFATQTLLWAGIAGVFGLLWDRGAAPSREPKRGSV